MPNRSSPIFIARPLTKMYRMGETEVHALRDIVVVYPFDTLRDGSRVTVK